MKLNKLEMPKPDGSCAIRIQVFDEIRKRPVEKIDVDFCWPEDLAHPFETKTTDSNGCATSSVIPVFEGRPKKVVAICGTDKVEVDLPEPKKVETKKGSKTRDLTGSLWQLAKRAFNEGRGKK